MHGKQHSHQNKPLDLFERQSATFTVIFPPSAHSQLPYLLVPPQLRALPDNHRACSPSHKPHPQIISSSPTTSSLSDFLQAPCHAPRKKTKKPSATPSQTRCAPCRRSTSRTCYHTSRQPCRIFRTRCSTRSSTLIRSSRRPSRCFRA